MINEKYTKTKQITKKFLVEIRKNLLLEDKIKFEDKNFQTNYCKKLIYLIKKIKDQFIQNSDKKSFEEIFYLTYKYILLRGANYLNQEILHSLNIMSKTSDDAYDFYEKFKKLILERTI